MLTDVRCVGRNRRQQTRGQYLRLGSIQVRFARLSEQIDKAVTGDGAREWLEPATVILGDGDRDQRENADSFELRQFVARYRNATSNPPLVELGAC